MYVPIIIISILGLFIVNLSIALILLERRFKRLLLGTKAKDLESAIHYLGDYLKEIKNTQKETEDKIQIINGKLKNSVQKVNTLRFNAFGTEGSSQSFAIAFLDEEKNGVVLSSLYARDRMSIFAKPIKNGNSIHELTEEEAHVLKETK